MSVFEWLERAATDSTRTDDVVDGDVRRSYRETLVRSRALARFLRSSGLEPGDRVAILDDNSAAYVETYFAAAAAGLILNPWNTRLTGRELAAIAAKAGARVAIARGSFAPAIRAAVEHGAPLAAIVWIGRPSVPVGIPATDYEDALGAHAGPFDRVAVADDAVLHLYFTSGTTGAPKGVMLTQRNVATHARWALGELELAATDVWAHVAPMFHLADAWATFAITAAGGRHVLLPRFDARATCRLVETERVTITNLVPTMLARVLAEPALEATDTSSLRRMLSGGAPIARVTVQRTMELFGCEYVQTYGLTETSPYVTLSLLPEHLRSLPLERQLDHRAKTGRPFAGVDVRVVGADGRPVAADGRAVGEIQVRGPTVTPGYWDDPDETAAAFTADGWLRTGDLATLDDEGFLDIVDRAKDVILTGGETVYSIEVENALYEHPAVLEAAVYAEPDDAWGERVAAAVAFRPGHAASAAELERHCRERLAGYKVPRRIRILDALPRTGSGKIAKRALRHSTA